MTVIQIDSSGIAQVEYHKKKRELEVTFKDGTVTKYSQLPVEVYDDFISADSKGRYFNYNIRGVFPDDAKNKD